MYSSYISVNCFINDVYTVQYQHYTLYKPSMKDCKGPTLSSSRKLKNYNQPTVIRCRVSPKQNIEKHENFTSKQLSA